MEKLTRDLYEDLVTAHKPATKLPWKDLTPLDMQREYLRQLNADYVLHAANWYPLLIEALMAMSLTNDKSVRDLCNTMLDRTGESG